MSRATFLVAPVFAITFLLGCSVTPLQPAGRATAHATVIGNGFYAGGMRLRNPVNDAMAVGEKLRSIGFKVTVVLDATQTELRHALDSFRQEAATADVSLLYFAGIGGQVDGANFVFPKDIDIRGGENRLNEAITKGAVNLDGFVYSIPGNSSKIFVLDTSFQRATRQALEGGGEPGPTLTATPENTLIAYAARDGQTVVDGDVRHSPFTQALLAHLSDPADISLVLRRVRDKVVLATSGKQQPWDYSSLTGRELVLSSLKNGK